MVRALVGAVAGAIAMFIIGFIFFATPLSKLGIGTLDDVRAAAVRQALAANLPQTATYYVPDPSTRAQSEMYSRGPVAMIRYNMKGFAPSDPAAMIGGFVHMLIVSLLIAWFLWLLARYVHSFAEQVKITGIVILGTTIFIRLGDPIWDHMDWTYSIYTLVADVAMLGTAALIILKLLPQQAAATPASADGGR